MESTMFKRLILFTLVALLGVNSSAARSGDNHKCDPNGNQSQLNACAKDDFEKADQKLNAIYRKLLAVQTYEEQQFVRIEQRAWLKKRDPKCREEADRQAKGGSMWPMVFSSCRAARTNNRSKKLENYFQKLAIDDSKPLLGNWYSNHIKMPHKMIIRGHDIVYKPGSKSSHSCKTTYSIVKQGISDTYPNNIFGVKPGRNYKVYKLKLDQQKCLNDLGYILLAIPTDFGEERYANVIRYNKDNRYFGYSNYSKVPINKIVN